MERITPLCPRNRRWPPAVRAVTLLAALALHATAAGALTVPFVEDFESGSAGFEDAVGDPVSFVPTGGADGGGFVRTEFSYFGFSSPFGGGPVIFRAHDSDDASGDAFVGDWLAAGVGAVRAFVRHDVPEGLTFFLRVATSFNFPGAVIQGSRATGPGGWQEIVFPIDPASPACIGESVSCADALRQVGNVQFGTDAPAPLVQLDQSFTFDLDRVALLPIPEPAAAASLVGGMLGLALLARRGRPRAGARR